MQIGLVDVYANHGILIIGADPELGAELTLQGATGVSPSHVMVATRGQIGLTRVRLWAGIGPRVGAEVVTAELELSNQYLFVYDIEKIGIHSFSTGKVGAIPVRIWVDEPGFASRVDILIGDGSGSRELTSVSGYRLFSVAVSSGMEMGAGDELGIILSGHDMPLSRLAAAIKLIVIAPVTRPAIRDSRIERLIEWGKWLTPRMNLEHKHCLKGILNAGIVKLDEMASDNQILDLATKALAKIDFAQ